MRHTPRRFSRMLTMGLAGVLALGAATPPALANDQPYFGTDGAEFSKDGECDDVRFTGEGMAEALLTDMIGRDASDCRAAWRKGTVTPNPLFAEPATPADIDFGDDASEYAKDGECDDIRFFHAGSKAAIYLVEDIGHDAADCRALMASGDGRWQANDKDIELGMVFVD